MAWNSCITHAVLSVMSYVAFFVAAVGGGSYLFVEWYKPLRQLEGFREEMQSFRLKANLIYLGIGLAFLGAGMVLGSIGAKSQWGFYWSWNAKQTITLLTWLYYFAAAALLAVHLALPKKKFDKLSAALAIGGLPLIAINLVVINFFVATPHRFL